MFLSSRFSALSDSRKRLILLSLLTVYLGGSCGLLQATRYRAPKPYADIMLQASERLNTAFGAIKDLRLSLGHPIDKLDDPNETGMIGDLLTDITTTHGILEAKRSAANPNSAAMVTDLMIRCGVKEGDYVACNFSSSFPTLDLATVCALDSIGAHGIIINSVGASTYGANLPDLTYLDMEQELLGKGLIRNHAEWFSLGGAGDVGTGMPEQVTEEIVRRARSHGLSYIHEPDLSANLEIRKEIYAAVPEKPVCFINVGGNLLSFAGAEEKLTAADGIVTEVRSSSEPQGLIPYFFRRGTPVIHLLNMKTLMPANGLPYDPVPLPAVGEGDVYSELRYDRKIAGLLGAGFVILSFLCFRIFPRRHIPL